MFHGRDPDEPRNRELPLLSEIATALPIDVLLSAIDPVLVTLLLNWRARLVLVRLMESVELMISGVWTLVVN
jgi:hypothetical protein